MLENYRRPQENGSHKDCERLTVKSGKIAVKVRAGEKPFSFSVLHYTAEQLTAARHDFELTEPKETVLRIDYGLSGIGSTSCGPLLDEKYQLNERKMAYNFFMEIIKSD